MAAAGSATLQTPTPRFVRESIVTVRDCRWEKGKGTKEREGRGGNREEEAEDGAGGEVSGSEARRGCEEEEETNLQVPRGKRWLDWGANRFLKEEALLKEIEDKISIKKNSCLKRKRMQRWNPRTTHCWWGGKLVQ